MAPLIDTEARFKTDFSRGRVRPEAIGAATADQFSQHEDQCLLLCRVIPMNRFTLQSLRELAAVGPPRPA